MLLALSLLCLITAVITIINANKKNSLFMVFKPLTTVLIILIALNAGINSSYSLAILAALTASLFGDVFLLFESKFILGLVSFLIAHIFYIKAFYSGFSRFGLLFFALPLLFYAGLMLRLLWPGLAKLKLPVLIYISAILLMAYQAAEAYHRSHGLSALLALAGALLFSFSDSVLALNKFRKPFKTAQLLILSSYYLAQWLISLSLYSFGG